MDFHFSEIEYIAGALCLFSTIISLCCSLIALRIIQDINGTSNKNGYFSVLKSLNACQIIYDCGNFLLPWTNNTRVQIIYATVLNFGGISVAMWSTLLVFAVFYIVRYRRKFDIMKFYPWMISFCMGPAIIFAIFAACYGRGAKSVSLRYMSNNFYYFIIALNLFFYTIISIALFRMKSSPAMIPVNVMAARLKYYPLFLALSRIPASYFQYAYPSATNIYSLNINNVSDKIVICMYGLLLPIGGVVYLIIFLQTQPRARKYFKAYIQYLNCGQQPSYCCCCSSCVPKGSEDNRGSYYQRQHNLHIQRCAEKYTLNSYLLYYLLMHLDTFVSLSFSLFIYF